MNDDERADRASAFLSLVLLLRSSHRLALTRAEAVERSLATPSSETLEALADQRRALIEMGDLIEEARRTGALYVSFENEREVDFAEIAQEAWFDARKGDPAFAQDETVRLEASTGIRLRADPGLLQYVLTRLFAVSIEGSPKGGVVRIGREDDAYFVEDQGRQEFRLALRHTLIVRSNPPRKASRAMRGLFDLDRAFDRMGARFWDAPGPGGGPAFWFRFGEAQPGGDASAVSSPGDAPL